MRESRADVLLHPIRMRMIMAVAGRRLTPQQIGAALPEVPQATLYRHLNKLVLAGILQVVEERPVRGTVEKVYALRQAAANLTRDDLANATRDDHMRYFTAFVVELLDHFARDLQQDRLDSVADGVGYRQAVLYLSDQELRDLAVALAGTFQQAAANEPAPGRRRRLFSTIVLPTMDDAES